MKSLTTIIVTIIFFIVSGCANQAYHVNGEGVAHLSDAPLPIEFAISGWSYTNTTNPFILTPDYLTNAMIAVSRLKPGKPRPNGPAVPVDLSINSLTQFLKEKTLKFQNTTITQKSANSRIVAIARYENESRQVIEYAFELNGVLVHILLMAKDLNYFKSGQVIAFNIINTIKVSNET